MTRCRMSGVLLILAAAFIIFPGPIETAAFRSDTYTFTGQNGNHILTLHGNLTSEGHVQLMTSGSRAVLELHSGGSVLVPMFPCLLDLEECVTGFTVSLTLKLSHVASGRLYILDSGSNPEEVSGLWLYQQDNTLACVVTGSTRLWRLEVAMALAPDRWHQLHVSWHHALGLTLWGGPHVLGSRVYPHPRQVRASRIGQLRAGSPGNLGSGNFFLSAITITSAFITDILEAGFSNENVNTTTQPSLTTLSPDIRRHRGVVIKFIGVTGQKNLMTNIGEMTSHGHVTLELVKNSLVLVMATQGGFVNLRTPIACLRDVTSCLNGFSTRVTFEPLEISTGPNFLLSSDMDLTEGNGLALYYYSGQFVFHVLTNETLWRGNFPYDVHPGIWYTVDASWDGHNLTLLANDLEVTGRVFAAHNTLPSSRTVGNSSLYLGGVPGYNRTTLMKVESVHLWPVPRSQLLPEELRLPDLQNESKTSPSQTEDTLLLCNTTPLPSTYLWLFNNVQNTTVTSNCTRATLPGFDRTMASSSGVRLEVGKYIQMDLDGRQELMCLSVPGSCRRGITVGLSLVLHQLEEGAVIFSSGGEVEDLQGVALLYRYGMFWATVNTERKSWYVNFSPTLIPLGHRSEVHVGWNRRDQLHVFVNSSLVGVANASDGHAHERSRVSGWGVLYVGNAPRLGFEPVALDITVAWLGIWLKGPESLIAEGVLHNPDDGGSEAGSPEPAQTGNTESLQSRGSAVDGEGVAVVVLGVLCSLLVVAAVVGGIILLRTRHRKLKKDHGISRREVVTMDQPQPSPATVTPPIEVGFFKSTPLAFHDRTFVNDDATHSDAMLY